MVESIRRHTSLLIAIVAIAALAASQVTARGPADVAREASDEGLTVAAGLNADTVDGKHAVSATNKAARRANKLVATNRKGYLPSNIVRVAWSQLRGIPAGFADGVDDIGPSYASVIIHVETDPLDPGLTREVTYGPVSRDIDLHFTVIPAAGNGSLSIEKVSIYRFAIDGDIAYGLTVRNDSTYRSTAFTVRALAFADGIAPAALKKTLTSARR